MSAKETRNLAQAAMQVGFSELSFRLSDPTSLDLLLTRQETPFSKLRLNWRSTECGLMNCHFLWTGTPFKNKHPVQIRFVCLQYVVYYYPQVYAWKPVLEKRVFTEGLP